MANQTTKVRNGTITLPREIRKSWKGAEVFMLPAEDSLLVKKVQKPVVKLSDLASRVSSKKMTRQEIDKEIQAFRKNK